MVAGARAVFPEQLGRALHAAARLVRLPGRSAQRRRTGRAIRQGQLYLYRLRLVPAVSGGRAGGVSPVRESGEFPEAMKQCRHSTTRNQLSNATSVSAASAKGSPA